MKFISTPRVLYQCAFQENGLSKVVLTILDHKLDAVESFKLSKPFLKLDELRGCVSTSWRGPSPHAVRPHTK